MKRIKDPLYRLAFDLREQLDRFTRGRRDQLDQQLAHLDGAAQAVSRSIGRSRLARSQGWHAAEALTREQAICQLRRLHEYIQDLGNLQNLGELQGQPPASTPPVTLLLAELRQLENEFESVVIGPGKGLIGIVTEPIILQDLDLGPFRIELHLERLSHHPGSASFDCVALEPNPAQSKDAVTHPHVRSLSLCAGDASAAIATALAQGRICDAFLLMAGVIRTYNPASPYVSLDDWTGVNCLDCDRRTQLSDLSYCDGCNREVCEDCIGSCEVCNDSCCQACLERDPRTRQSCCPVCRSTCSGCARTVNCDDFDKDSELCPQCLEQQEEFADEPDPHDQLIPEHLSDEEHMESIQVQTVHTG